MSTFPDGSQIQMLSTVLHIYDKQSATHAVFGWRVDFSGRIEPIVGNPDGPGVGPWRTFHGEDPWYTG